MKYLVTGGCGFIGSHLVELLLSEGHSVTILDNLSSGRISNVSNLEVEIIQSDITYENIFDEILAKNEYDGVFHLAAISSITESNHNWLNTHRVNISGLVALYQAISRFKKKIPVVYASSAAVYGNLEILPASEDSVCEPITAYGADKLACEQHSRVAWNIHNIPSCGLRFFNVYGERQDPKSPYSGVISIFANKLNNYEKISIHGDGEQTRDFIYVKDVALNLYTAMKKCRIDSNVINVCTGEETSINQLLNTMIEILSASGKLIPEIEYLPPRSGDIRKSYGSTEFAKEHLGINSNTSLRDGLTRYMASL